MSSAMSRSIGASAETALPRADWNGPVLDEIEAERRKRLPADKLQERQAWRDRRLMALAAHKRGRQEYSRLNRPRRQ